MVGGLVSDLRVRIMGLNLQHSNVSQRRIPNQDAMAEQLEN
jgi:hypothetical protein